MIYEEFDAHLYIHQAPMPIGIKTIEIDYFNIAKDQLGRIVILRPEWKYYLLLNREDRFKNIHLFYPRDYPNYQYIKVKNYLTTSNQ